MGSNQEFWKGTEGSVSILTSFSLTTSCLQNLRNHSIVSRIFGVHAIKFLVWVSILILVSFQLEVLNPLIDILLSVTKIYSNITYIDPNNQEIVGSSGLVGYATFVNVSLTLIIVIRVGSWIPFTNYLHMVLIWWMVWDWSRFISH